MREIVAGEKFTFKQVFRSKALGTITYIYDVEIIRINQKSIRFHMKDRNGFGGYYTIKTEEFMKRYGQYLA